MRFERHLFICENVRAPDNPLGCCAAKGSVQIREALKTELKQRGLSKRIRVNAAGCLDACEHGVSIVVYGESGEEAWYGGVTLEDVPTIVEQHLVGGCPVERLRIRAYSKKP